MTVTESPEISMWNERTRIGYDVHRRLSLVNIPRARVNQCLPRMVYEDKEME